MSLRITDECISCGACEDACPTAAIFVDTKRDIRVINPELCTECVGFYERTMCRVECPVDCITSEAGDRETEATLFAKAKSIFPQHKFPEQPPSHLR